MAPRASRCLARAAQRPPRTTGVAVAPLSFSSARPFVGSFISTVATWAARRPYSSDSKAAPSPRASKRRSVLPIVGATALLIAGSAYLYLSHEEHRVLAPDRWTDVKIKSVTPMTPETSLFRLEVPRSLLPPAFTSDPNARPILSLFVKEPNLQIQRAYTPLSATSFSTSGPAELDLVIKRYADGEASRYVHRLGPGDNLSVRGPSCTWFYRPRDWDEVVFVVGGTGVTPAYQLIHDALSAASSPATPSPAVSIVYASPSPSRILLKESLDALAGRDPAHVKVHYLVDRLDVGQGKGSLPPGAEVGFIDRKNLEKLIGRGGDKTRRRVVVVCGPEGMVNAVAGPRGRNFSAGPVGGILRELGYTDREVVKL
ncbi:hypothetical protein JCM3770_005713 [Rhodotorula araucariae]